MSLDLKDKTYINDTVHKISAHYVGILKEVFDDRIKMLAELIQDRPTRNDVRNMIKEEVEPIRMRLVTIERVLSI